MSAEEPMDQAEIEEVEELHRFWSAQPVSRLGENPTGQGYIDESIPVTAPPDSPAALPAGFQWSTIDITEDDQLQEVYNFLAANYVESEEHEFRFMLSPTLLRWALTSPGAIKEWVFGVRTAKGVLVGFISGVPYRMRLEEDVQPWCAVNFLCAHQKLRMKNLAPILIFELARRVRQAHVYRAVFCGSCVPSQSFCKSAYCHRPLNLKKMDAVGFYPIDPKRMGAAQKRFALPSLVHGNCRPMREEDVEGVTTLLRETGQKFKFDIDWTPEMVRHLLLPKEDVVYSYILPSASGPTALFSFYIMNWKVLKGTPVDIRAAYIWYLASNSVNAKSLIADLLNKAVNEAKADVCTSTGTGGLRDALVANKFETGSKELEFYSYNYAVPAMEPTDMRLTFI